MLGVLSRFFERRRRSFMMLVTTVGGGYLLMSYIKSKLNEMQEALTRNRITTDNLRRRFHQNQEDCLFTVTALVPTIGHQILESMNVERLADLLNQTKKPRLAEGPAQDNAQDNAQDHSPQNDPGPTIEDTHTGNHSEQIKIPTIEVIPGDDGLPTQPVDGLHITSSSQSSSDPGFPISNPNPDNSLDVSNVVTPEGQQVINALLRPDGTALRKRSEIWKELMILSFTRLFTCLYGITLLTMQTHIQLGLLGRDAYLSSVISADDPNSTNAPDECDQLFVVRKHDLMDVSTERRYLTFSWWYLHHGWRLMSNRIRVSVEEVLSRRSLKEDIGVTELGQIFGDVRLRVEQREDGEAFSFSPILLPSTTLDELETLRSGGMSSIDCVVDSRLRELLNETQDFIDCDDFHSVLRSAMDRITQRCLENVGRRAKIDDSGLTQHVPTHQVIHPRFTELAEDGSELHERKTSRFVAILPIITRESHNILNLLPNEYTELLGDTSELKEFSSVIYTSFDTYT